MKKLNKHVLVSGMSGNLVEAFDMAICGLLSIYIGHYLMGDVEKGLIWIFSAFFIGYLARPLGAIFLGLFSDIYGRKIVLAVSILTMGIATTLIGMIPSYGRIGLLALVLLLMLRLIQSFFCGAEYLNASAYLVENAHDENKGYLGSWASFGAMMGLWLASIAAYIVHNMALWYPEIDWLIWRVPFMLALVGTSIGLYIRLFIPESFEYIMYYADHAKPSLKNLVKYSFNQLAQDQFKSCYVIALSALGVATTFQIYIYGPTQAHLYGNISDDQVMLANILSLVVMLSVFPIVGKLSDKVSREKIMLIASYGFVLLSMPYFYALSYGPYKNLLLYQSLISMPAGAYYATVPVLLTSMFPLKLRCTVLSFLYSIAASLSAGLTPLLSMTLLKRTHNALSPVLLIISLVIIVTVMFGLRTKKYISAPTYH